MRNTAIPRDKTPITINGELIPNVDALMLPIIGPTPMPRHVTFAKRPFTLPTFS
ncbi:hypothetical protein ACFL60_03090 [Candidatus Omnitrophota bacterium]